MKALLDTNALLWSNAEPERLSRPARLFIESGANDLFLSAVTAWEVAVKYAKGHLRLPKAPKDYISACVVQDGLKTLPIEVSHALAAGALPPIHRDPFDRLLVAQCQLEDLPILTSDPNIARYGVSVIW